jgi:hypothetical protein
MVGQDFILLADFQSAHDPLKTGRQLEKLSSWRYAPPRG